MRSLRIVPQCNANKEPIAAKYCFIAKSSIHTSKTVPGPRKTVGVIFGFDKTPDISSHIIAVGRTLEAKGNYSVDDPELTLMEECPVEVSDNVYVQFFNQEDASDQALQGIDSEVMSSSEFDKMWFDPPTETDGSDASEESDEPTEQ
jgi:hypothetical protein